MTWRFLTAAVLIVVGGAWSIGQCPNGVCSQQQAVEVAAVQQVLLVPAYYASYTPTLEADPPMKQSTTDELLRQLIEEIRGLRKDIAGPGPAAPAVAPPPVPKVDPVAASVSRVIGTSCIKCHAAAVAEQKGGGFVMVGPDNKTPQFTPAELRRIVNRVQKKEMPPKSQPPLAADEVGAMAAFFAK